MCSSPIHTIAEAGGWPACTPFPQSPQSHSGSLLSAPEGSGLTGRLRGPRGQAAGHWLSPALPPGAQLQAASWSHGDPWCPCCSLCPGGTWCDPPPPGRLQQQLPGPCGWWPAAGGRGSQLGRRAGSCHLEGLLEFPSDDGDGGGAALLRDQGVSTELRGKHTHTHTRGHADTHTHTHTRTGLLPPLYQHGTRGPEG